MKNLIYILFLCTCLMSCKQCKKKQAEPDQGFSSPVNTDLYAYAYFKPGTYWVYQDSISGILDSVYIIFANKGTYTNGDAEVAQGYYRGTFNWFQCDAISSYDHYKYQNWMDQSYEVDNGSPRVFRSKYIMSNSGNNAGKTLHMGAVDVGKEFFIYPDKVIYEKYYSSFQLQASSYLATEKWYNKKSVIDNEQDTYYYIAKNIGIVRREQLDSNRTWNLIRYNIIQ
jgi:hypothetical protein